MSGSECGGRWSLFPRGRCCSCCSCSMILSGVWYTGTVRARGDPTCTLPRLEGSPPVTSAPSAEPGAGPVAPVESPGAR